MRRLMADCRAIVAVVALAAPLAAQPNPSQLGAPQSVYDTENNDKVNSISPDCGIPRGMDVNGQGAPLFIPHTVSIGRFDVENITSGIKICIGGRSSDTGIVPLLIIIFEPKCILIFRRIEIV